MEISLNPNKPKAVTSSNVGEDIQKVAKVYDSNIYNQQTNLKYQLETEQKILELQIDIIRLRKQLAKALNEEADNTFI